jgi:20S proteasome alpha/beta subunit
MTVCVAAICNTNDEAGPIVVTAADRMITIGEIEYEPQQTKAVILASMTVALLAGDMTFHAAVVPRVEERIREDLQEHPENINVARIAEIYAEEYSYRRRHLAEQHVLKPRGLDFERFTSRQNTMAHYQVSNIDNELLAYRVDASAIITGLDPTGGHIFVVENPGISHSYDVPSFACIGSGEYLARTQFMVKRYSRSWSFPAAVWITFDAKARTQSAGGVGRETDMYIIMPGGKINPASDEEKAMLNDLFEKTRQEEDILTEQNAKRITEYIMSALAKSAEENKEPSGQTEAPSDDEMPAQLVLKDQPSAKTRPKKKK